MPKIVFVPQNKSITVPENSDLIDAVHEAGFDIDIPCGGKGACGKCAVKVHAGSVKTEESGKLSKEKRDKGYVLACKTKIADTSITIEIPAQACKDQDTFFESLEHLAQATSAAFPKEEDYDSGVKQISITVPKAQLEEGLADLDRIEKVLRSKMGNMTRDYSLFSMQKIAQTVREDGGNLCITLVDDKEGFKIIDVSPPNNKGEAYGLAIDLGTTSVSTILVSLSENKVVGATSSYNEQISCGLDIISRINYAKKPARLQELAKRAVNTINRQIRQLTDEHGVRQETIYSVSLSGNTTMVHLLLGLLPEYIRIEPYTPTLLTVPTISARTVGLVCNPEAPLYCAPAVGSYVGGDITAGLLCTDIIEQRDLLSLYIDIGTNGEIVLGNREFLMTCACSAGPAFEGGGIEFGMRAASGAIDRVSVDPQTGQATYSVIGKGKPLGLCGSGLITLVASLFSTGWLDAAGKFDQTRTSKALVKEGRQCRYVLVPEDESGIDGPIYLSEHDVENVVRTKAAIYSATALLCKQLEIEPADLQAIYIAGGFGQFLDMESAITLGLLPDLPRDRFHYVGNASLIGSYLALVSKKHQKKQQELAQMMTYVELNTDPAYMDQYTAALFIPHTDRALFPSVKNQ